MEIFGSIDDGNLGRKRKKKEKKNHVRLGAHDHKAIHPGFRTLVSDLNFRTWSCPSVEVLKPRSVPGRTNAQTAELIKRITTLPLVQMDIC